MIWPLLFFWKFANWAAKNGKGVSLSVAFLLWVNNVIDNVIAVTVDGVAMGLKLINLDAFANVNLATLPYIGFINGVFPLTEFVQMGTIFVAACVALVVIRWVKSFVPTIAN